LVTREESFLTTNYVLVESFALVQSRLGMPALRLFQDDILPAVGVHFVDHEMHRSSVSAVLSAGKRNLSLVDCSSFVIMRAFGLKNAFTFDPHFKEQGFTVIP